MEEKSESKYKICTPANAVSGARIIGSLGLGYFMWKHGFQHPKKVGFCYAGLALSDKVDGYLAKHYNQITELGKALDPVGDKILIWSTAASMLKWKKIELPKSASLLLLRDLYVASKTPYRVKYDVNTVTELGRLRMVLFSMMEASALLLPEKKELLNQLTTAAIGVSALDMIAVSKLCRDADKRAIAEPREVRMEHIKRKIKQKEAYLHLLTQLSTHLQTPDEPIKQKRRKN